jgi:hypothetical protein
METPGPAHCGSKKKKERVGGDPPTNIFLFGIVPMGVVCIGIVPMGVVSTPLV